VHRIDLSKPLYDEAANGTLFCLVHPVQRYMVRVGIQRELGAQGVVAAFVCGPKKRISFEVERGLEALGLIEGFGKEKDDGHILRSMNPSVVRILISVKDIERESKMR
jgi:hypothetical protein